jgi:hypothetical protein
MPPSVCSTHGRQNEKPALPSLPPARTRLGPPRHERALEAVVRLRDDGQIRQAKAELARAERLHARIEAIDRAFDAGR